MLEGRLQDGNSTSQVDHAARSSCCWHFCAEHVEQCSSCKEDAFSPAQEASLRKSYCTFMQKLGKQLKLPQVTIATAIIFCHHFFLRQSLARNDRYIIATVCIFLAGKVEETPERLHNVIVVSYELRNAEDPDAASRIKQKEVYEEQKELLLMGERIVLVTLGFNLNVSHPYKPLIAAIKRLTLPHTISRSQLAQIAWNFVNDGLQTLLCLQFKPCHVAAGALFLAAKFLRIKLCDWEELLSKEFDVSLQQLEDVSNQILQSYESLAKPSVNGSGTKRLIRVRANMNKDASNEACTYSLEDLATATPMVKCVGDSHWPLIHGKAKVEVEIETTISQKTHPGRFDVENATCHTGNSDLTEEKGPELGRGHHPEEDDWDYDGGRSHEELDRSHDHPFSMEDVDGRSMDKLWLYGRERKMKRVDRDDSPFEKGRDDAMVAMSKHNPWVRIGSRHRGIRQVPSRREPLVGLFGINKDVKRAVTRREFLLRLSNKRKPVKASMSTPDHLNVRLQNRLKLLRQKDEILKKHQSWGPREHCIKRPR